MKIKMTEADKNPQNSEQMFAFIAAGLVKEGGDMLGMVQIVKDMLDEFLVIAFDKAEVGRHGEAIRFSGMMLNAALVKVAEKYLEQVGKQ
jgi:hypothetical protein